MSLLGLRSVSGGYGPVQVLRDLDLEVAEFRERPSTGENIVQALWPRLAPRLDGTLVRLRVFETENNRFTLRQAS